MTTETQVWGDQYRHPDVGADLAAGADRVADLGGAADPSDRARRRSAVRKRGDRQRRCIPGISPRTPRVEQVDARTDSTRPIGHFEAAIRDRPESTRARMPGSPRHTASWATTATWPTEVAMTRASAAAYAALDLDPRLAEAHAAMGVCRMFHSWDWIGAEHALRKGLELEPRNSDAPHVHGAAAHHARAARRGDCRGMRRGRELDPLSCADADGRGLDALFRARVQEGARRRSAR